MALDALYTSAPILDYDEDAPEERPATSEEMAAPGVSTLAPEAFDAAILEAHRAGSSLREIDDASGISHMTVKRIVERTTE